MWVANKTEGEHPTQKPLLLVRKWIDQFTDKGETILDPFMGSGTTGVAAVERGRDFIGVELSAKYFEVARWRIEEVEKQQAFGF